MLARRQRRVHDAIEAVTIVIDVAYKNSDVFRQASKSIFGILSIVDVCVVGLSVYTKQTTQFCIAIGK